MTDELTVEAKMHMVIADVKRCIDTEGRILQAYEKLDYLDSLVKALVPEALERAADIADVMSIAPWGGEHEAITPKHLALQIAAAIRKSVGTDASGQERPQYKHVVCKRCKCSIDNTMCGYNCDLDGTPLSERSKDDCEIRVYSLFSVEPMP